MEASKKAQVGVTYTARVAKLSCGEGLQKGEANLQRAIEREDVILRNGVYYEPTHVFEAAELHSSGVEGSSAVQMEGADMQSVLDKLWGTAQDQYKGFCNPTTQLHQPH